MNPRHSLLATIGNTPLVELGRVRPSRGARILAKPEGSNPGGSVKDRPAYSMANTLALEEGLFVGMSSGAAVCGAVQVASTLPEDAVVVTLLPDRGDRYLSTSLFRSVCAECPP